MNTMQKTRIEKVTVNMGVGQAGEELKKAVEILKMITGSKPAETKCKIKQPTWGIRENLPIGAKATLRGKKAREFLEKAFTAKEKRIKADSFDQRGNFGFGVKEYIEMPGAKYDPKVGIRGFDVLVTLEKPGYRVKKRRNRKKLGKKHVVTKQEAQEFIQMEFGVELEK